MEGNSAGQQAVVRFVKELLVEDTNADSVIRSSLTEKVTLLDNVPDPVRKVRPPLKRKTLSSKEKKNLKVFEIPKECQTYSLYQPLHDLWKQYMARLFAGTNAMMLRERLLKADYHGCYMTVVQSKCPTYVGVAGILLQETTNTFKIITRENALKTIPKANSVFTTEAEGNTITIYGTQFCYRTYDRAARKFKSKPTIEL